MEQVALSGHARARMSARRIQAAAVDMAIRYGRERHVRGATLYAVGRREVDRYGREGVDLRGYEGIQVVCVEDWRVVTVYRNHDFSGLRPRGPGRRRRRRRGRQASAWSHGVAA